MFDDIIRGINNFYEDVIKSMISVLGINTDNYEVTRRTLEEQDYTLNQYVKQGSPLFRAFSIKRNGLYVIGYTADFDMYNLNMSATPYIAEDSFEDAIK